MLSAVAILGILEIAVAERGFETHQRTPERDAEIEELHSQISDLKGQISDLKGQIRAHEMHAAGNGESWASWISAALGSVVSGVTLLGAMQLDTCRRRSRDTRSLRLLEAMGQSTTSSTLDELPVAEQAVGVSSPDAYVDGTHGGWRLVCSAVESTAVEGPPRHYLMRFGRYRGGTVPGGSMREIIRLALAVVFNRVQENLSQFPVAPRSVQVVKPEDKDLIEAALLYMHEHVFNLSPRMIQL